MNKISLAVALVALLECVLALPAPHGHYQQFSLPPRFLPPPPPPPPWHKHDTPFPRQMTDSPVYNSGVESNPLHHEHVSKSEPAKPNCTQPTFGGHEKEVTPSFGGQHESHHHEHTSEPQPEKPNPQPTFGEHENESTTFFGGQHESHHHEHASEPQPEEPNPQPTFGGHENEATPSIEGQHEYTIFSVDGPTTPEATIDIRNV